MHQIQDKILQLMETKNLGKLTLREIGASIGEPDRPQKIKHHLDQLAKKGLIRVDKANSNIERIQSGRVKNSNLVAVPIFGSATCGEAACFDEQNFEGNLYVSDRLLNKIRDVKNIFAVKAVGSSMNRADIQGKNIVEGDYAIIDKDYPSPQNGDYVLSVIDGLINIKKFYQDKKNNQIILMSESTQDFAPIYIHEEDFVNYMVNGKVVQVFKQPNEEQLWQDAAAVDVLKDIGPISKKDYDYYENLCLKKAK